MSLAGGGVNRTPSPMTRSESIPEQVDVVIIGAGIVGAACFYHLASAGAGLRIVCFEQHVRSSGSTARSAAAFRHQFSAEVHVRMSLASGRFYREMPKRFDCPPVLRENGYLFLYSENSAWQAALERLERQRELGVPDLEALGPDEIERRFNWIETNDVVGATFCARDGFVLPDLVTHVLFEAGMGTGGCLKQYAPVEEIVREGDRVFGVRVRTDEGERVVRANVVINAAGPWANIVSSTAGLPIPLTPVKRYLYFTQQIRARNVQRMPMCVFDLEPYCRPEAEALMCGWDKRPEKPPGWDRFPPPEIEADQLDPDRIEPGFGVGIEDYGYEVLAELARYMPWLADEAGIEHVSAGYYEVTPDEKAIIAWDPRLEGLLHVTGFSGHGVMHAPAAGQMVRDLVLGRRPAFSTEALALAPLLVNQPRPDPERVVI